jgi:hypothetical protein
MYASIIIILCGVAYMQGTNVIATAQTVAVLTVVVVASSVS